MQETKRTTPFGHRVCGRCCGSGTHSWCQRYGDVCFSCGGRGWVLTPRGSAACKYFTSLLSKPWSEVRVGDTVRVEDVTMSGEPFASWMVVESLEDGECQTGRMIVATTRAKASTAGRTLVVHGLPQELVRYSHTAAEREPKLQAALEFEKTLTVKGEPRKIARRLR